MVSMTEKYVSNNFQDAAEKMNGVIGLYKGEWVYLSNWRRGTGLAEIAYIDPAKQGIRDAIDFAAVKAEDFSFGPYLLGFCESSGELYYVARDPVRKNKFGLRDDNMGWTPIMEEEGDPRGRPNNFNAAWRDGTFFKMLTGDYDGLAKAVKKFKSAKVRFAPINRDFALVRVGLNLCSLFYKLEQVGEVDLTNAQVNLYPSFDHLQERVNRTVLET